MNNTAEGLFTKEQTDYVNSVKDEDLRSHLLHQVRLRDNMEADRDKFEKAANVKLMLSSAIDRLVLELSLDKSEGSYYYAWQANIAMSFYDEYFRATGEPTDNADKTWVHAIANNAAKNFLDLLISQTENSTNE